MLRTPLAVLLLGLLVPSILLGAKAPREPIVVGYIFAQEGPLPPGRIDAHGMNRINYAFANIRDGRIVAGSPSDAKNFEVLNELKKENPSLKIIVSVGGWLWSDHFSDMALTAQSRAVFIQSVMEFLRAHDLDGLDIDWEYPGMAGSSRNFRPGDGHNLTLLVKELRSHFDEQAKRTHKRLYLTIAAGSSDEYLSHTEMGKTQEYLDTVNLMAYDYVEPGDEPLTGHHSPLFATPSDTRNFSTDQSVQAFEHAGVPAEKILMGVPFYGHVWGGVSSVNHGLLQAGKAIPKTYAPYRLIMTDYIDHGYLRYWDSSAQAPYLYNQDKHIFVSYEDPESLAAKCHYVRQHKLGGIMFWEYYGDTTGALLGAINRGLHNESPKK